MDSAKIKNALAAAILDGTLPVDWEEVRRIALRAEYRNFAECVKLVKEVADELQVPCIPIEGSISWDDWLKGRRARRESSQLVAPGLNRREDGPDDERLRKLFNGERGLPFTPTDKL